MSPKLFSFLFTASLALPSLAEGEWQSLFNGQDLTGWDKVIAKEKFGTDPQGFITVHDGLVHMYENTPSDDNKYPFGVIMTKKSYSQFHFSCEYRWVGKRFHPRKTALRDAGLLYHCFGDKKIWPPSVECQIQEGDTGDIVFIKSNGLSWMHPRPNDARKGQGKAGLLAESGGVLQSFEGPGFAYIGRFTEPDHLTEWNTVEAVVHAGDYALHKVNGQIVARLLDMRQPDGTPLTQGPLALQLEGAEIQYRNIKIKQLDGYLKPSAYQVALSQVGSLKSHSQTITVKNTSSSPLSTAPVILGKNATAFDIEGSVSDLKPGETHQLKITFRPDFGPGSYTAGIQVGDESTGCFVQLTGIMTPALEGKNEPPLQAIVHALGSTLQVGGTQLSLDSKAATIGSSINTSTFQAIEGKAVQITPIARYSPPGNVPFGLYDAETKEKTEIGQLAASSADTPDAHQSLLNPHSKGRSAISLPKTPDTFGLYLSGPHFTSYTHQGMSEKAKIPHTARIYPIKSFLGRRMQNSYIVGFEEATNGDYQDALFLIENVKAIEAAEKKK